MNDEIDNGVPVIKTERLILRELRSDDAAEYYNYHTNPDLLEYYDWKPESISDAEGDIRSIIQDCINQSRIHWAITMKDNDSIIGDLGILIDSFHLKGEVNYMLSKSHSGAGIMTEALGAVIAYVLKETDIIRIQALSVPENQYSNNLLVRMGFLKEGLLKKYGYNTITSRPVDLIMWALLK